MRWTICAALALALAAGTAWGDTLTIKFSGTDGVVSSMRFSDHPTGGGENGWDNFNHNTGADAGSAAGDIMFSEVGVDWFYPITMFRPVLTPLPGSAVVTDAYLDLHNNWYSPIVWSNVEIRRIQVPGGVDWQPGNGVAGTRNGPQQDAGVGQWFADWQPNLLIGGTTNNGGVAWNGTLEDKWTARQNAPYIASADASSALTTLLWSGTLDGGAWSNQMGGLAPIVNDWVNGVYKNEGFALSAMNVTLASTTACNRFAIGVGGLVLTYTTAMPGDATKDGQVDMQDYQVWFADFGMSVGATWTQGDFTGDGQVDMADYQIWFANFGAVGGPSVPEPMTVALLAFGLPLIRRRRRAPGIG